MKKILLVGILYILASYISYSSNYDPMIEEGNVWEYFSSYDDDYWCTKLELRGDSLHNGKIYKKCHWTRVNYDSYPGDGDVPPSSIDSFSSGLVREEDGKVWMVYDKISDPYISYCFGTKNQEILIYDMHLNVGDTLQMCNDSLWNDYEFCHYSGYQWYMSGKFVVDHIGEREIHGKVRKAQYFKFLSSNLFFEILEGIGCTNEGLLLFPFSNSMLASAHGEPYLRYMASNNGNNVKYGATWLSAKTVLNAPINVYSENSTIIIEGDYSSYSVTDISGRSWNTLTVPAGLYIVTVDGHPHKVKVK